MSEGKATTLKGYQILALGCLARGPHSIGVIDDENKAAAAHALLELQKLGLAISTIEQDGPRYRLTPFGQKTSDAVLPVFREGRLTGMEDAARFLEAMEKDRRDKGDSALASICKIASGALREGIRQYEKEPAA